MRKILFRTLKMRNLTNMVSHAKSCFNQHFHLNCDNLSFFFKFLLKLSFARIRVRLKNSSAKIPFLKNPKKRKRKNNWQMFTKFIAIVSIDQSAVITNGSIQWERFKTK